MKFSASSATGIAFGTSQNVPLKPHVAGNLLICQAYMNYGALDVTPTGWSVLGTHSSGIMNRVMYGKIAASSAETLTLGRASSYNGTWGAVAVVVEGADVSGGTPTSALSGSMSSVVTSTNAEFSQLTPAITTTVDGIGLLHFSYIESSDGAYPDVVGGTALACARAYTQMAVSTDFQGKAGDIDRFVIFKPTSGHPGAVWSVQIKAASTSPKGLKYKDGRSYLSVCPGKFGTAYGARVALSSLTGFTAVAGLPLFDSTLSITYQSGLLMPERWLAWKDASGDSLNAGTYPNGAYVGFGVVFPSPVDLTGKLLTDSISYGSNIQYCRSYGGHVLILLDSSFRWAAVMMNTESQMEQGPTYSHLIPFSACDFLDFSYTTPGTPNIDFTDIKYYFIAQHRKPAVTNNPDATISSLTYGGVFSPSIVTGYSELEGSSVKDIAERVNPQFANLYSVGTPSTAYYRQRVGLANTQGLGQLLLAYPLQIGDGNTPTRFRLAGQSIEFSTYDATLRPLVDNCLALVLYPSAFCVFNLSSGIIASETRQTVSWHASANGTGVTTANLSIIGVDVQWQTAIPAYGVAFAGCYTVVGEETKFDNCFLFDCVLTSGAYLSLDGGADTDSRSGAVSSTFTKGTEDYAVELRTAGFYDFTDTTFTGYTNELHISGPAGTYNIRLAVGQTQPDVYNPNSRTIVWDVPVNTLTIAGSVTLLGAEVRIYDYDNTPSGTYGTVIDGIESCVAATFSTPIASGNTVWIQIIKDGYVEFGQAYVMGASATFTAILLLDTNE